MPDDVAAHSAA